MDPKTYTAADACLGDSINHDGAWREVKGLRYDEEGISLELLLEGKGWIVYADGDSVELQEAA